jgi:hypothetical protein
MDEGLPSFGSYQDRLIGWWQGTHRLRDNLVRRDTRTHGKQALNEACTPGLIAIGFKKLQILWVHASGEAGMVKWANHGDTANCGQPIRDVCGTDYRVGHASRVSDDSKSV